LITEISGIITIEGNTLKYFGNEYTFENRCLQFGCYSFKDSLITALISYINLVCFGRAVYTFSTSQFLTPSLPNGCCLFVQVVVESIFMHGAANTLATSSVETLTCSNSWILTMDWPVSAPCSPLPSLSGGNFNRFWNGSQSDSGGV
jgi:hypothetical protein